MIPLFKVAMDPHAYADVKEILDSGYIGEGPRVKEFERKLGEYLGVTSILATNSCTSALDMAYHLIGIGKDDVVISTPMTCVSGKTPVLLANGTTMPISKIVNQRLGVRVLSLGEGGLVSKKVTDWVKLDGDGVEWFHLALRNAVANNQRGRRGIWVTGDHRVLTRKGYMRVDELTLLDEVATKDKEPNSLQKELIEGTMLGDASIMRPKKTSARFSFTHAVSQEEWVNTKVLALDGIDLHISRSHNRPEKRQAALRAESKNAIFWRKERKRWYTARGKKKVPVDVKLTPVSLAAWYLDDGCLVQGTAVFSTQGFSSESFWRLFWKLADIGFRPRAFRRISEGYSLRITKDDAEAFFALIGKYIPTRMRYKVPKNAPQYEETSWDLGSAVVTYDEVVRRRKSPPKHHRTSNVYCIEVEDLHNFIAGGMILENCLATNMPLALRGVQIIWADVDKDTGNIDPNSVAELNEKYSGVDAIICTDWAGRLCDYEAIRSAAPGIPIVEDAAHRFEPLVRPHGDYVCFPGTIQVDTKRGSIPISKVKVGDFVLTESGKYHIVLKTHHRKYKGLWTRIKAGQTKFICTEKHPIRVWRNGISKWIPANKIRREDSVYIKTKACSKKKCLNLIPFYGNVCADCFAAADISPVKRKKLKLHQKMLNRKRDGAIRTHSRITSSLAHHERDVEPRMREYQRDGYRVIPMIHAIPDFLALKNGKITAVEVQSGTGVRLSQEEKYERLNGDGYDEVVWITKEKKREASRYSYEIDGIWARVPVVRADTGPWGGYNADSRTVSVYNLTVDQDPTYVARGILVHNCYSFQAIKHVTCGDGGALVLPEAQYERAKRLRWYGLDREDSTAMRCLQQAFEPGFKYQMNDIAATIGLANLYKVDKRLQRNRANAEYYSKYLPSKIAVPYDPGCSYWLYTILVDDPAKFEVQMTDRGISVSQVHTRNDDQECLPDADRSLPGLDAFQSRMVSIPVGWWVSDEDRKYIVEQVNDLVRARVYA